MERKSKRMEAKSKFFLSANRDFSIAYVANPRKGDPLGLGVIIKQPIEAKNITRQRLLVGPDVDLESDDSRHDSTAF